MARRTKVIVTLGPATVGPPALAAMKARGVDFVRANMSHSTIAYLRRCMGAARRAGIPFIIDTEGSQVRTGELRETAVRFEPGADIRLWAGPEPGAAHGLPLRPAAALEQLEEGDLLHIDFDSVILRVTDVSAASRGTVRACAVTGGTVGRNKAVVLDPLRPRRLELPALSAKDLESIRLGLAGDVGHIAVSFVRSWQAVEDVREATRGRMKIISKIECVQALEQIDQIIDRSDYLLIDRGDLSKEIPLERIPFVQKIVIHKARARGVGVFVATNLLETMVERRHPTRAEVHDVVNTILDGAAGLTLASETAVGRYPIECVNMLMRLIDHAESVERIHLADPAGGALAEALGRTDYLVRDREWPTLPPPHGGRLVDRVARSARGGAAAAWTETVTIEPDRQARLELVASGAYSPLQGFMGSSEIESVVDGLTLADGTPWPVPVVLDVTEADARRLSAPATVALADTRGRTVGLLELEEVFPCDPSRLESGQGRHRGWLLAGRVHLLAVRPNLTRPWQLNCTQTRRLFEERGWQRVLGVIATQPPPPAAARHLQQALAEASADGLLVQVAVDPNAEASVDVIRRWERLWRRRPRAPVFTAALPAPLPTAGRRGAILAALVLKNFGCSHCHLDGEADVVGRRPELEITPVAVHAVKRRADLVRSG